jgi:predicted dehydrogenase
MKVVMVSGWHVHAKGYAKQLQEHPACKVVGVWDSDALWENGTAKGKAWADELGCKFHKNYDDVLSDPDVDGVAVCAPSNRHPNIIVQACDAGKAVFTEKVLALTAAEAYAIRGAVIRNHTLFTISFPHKTNPALLYAKALAESGRLGTLTYARVRNVHSGSISIWLLGHPDTVQSCFGSVTGRPVEDNAVCLLGYRSGAVGVSETGFVSIADPYICEVSGTKGAVHVRGTSVSYANEETDRKWVTVETLPAAPASPLYTWVDAFVNNTAAVYGIDQAVELSEIMDAAYRSYHSGKKESL